MTFLVVLGTGVWGYADSNRVMRNFPAGVHEVDEETTRFALNADNPNLVITEERPVIAVRNEGKTVVEKLRLGSDGSVYIPRAPEPGAPEIDPFDVPYDYPCGRCPWKFPSKGARDRHFEFHHTPRHVD